MTMIVSRPASDLVPRVLPFLWRKRFPLGAVSVLAGRPGSSKSTLTAFIAAEISRAGLVTVMSNPEDDAEAVTVSRLDAHKARMRLIELVPDECFFTLPRHLVELEEFVRETEATMLVLDPIASHFPRLHSRPDLRALALMAKRTRCCVLCVHHTVKNKEGLEGVGGGMGGLIGTARSVYEFAPMRGDEDSIVLDCLKINGAPKPPRLVFHRDQVITRNGLASVRLKAIGRHFDYGSPGEIAEAAEWLTLYVLAGGCERPLTEVRSEAERVGVQGDVLAGLVDDMGFEITQNRGMTWVVLPNDHPLREAA